MNTQLNMKRRTFLGATTASGLTIGFAMVGLTPSGSANAATGNTVNSWLNVGTDNSITLTVGPCEMGQGSSSSLAQILSEDLMVDFSRIAIVQGEPNLASSAIGTAIVAGGSSVIRNNYWKFRNAAAIARETLVMAAMARLQDSNRSNFTVSNGVIMHNSGQTLAYGAVAADAALLKPPMSAPLVPDSQLKAIGKSLPRLDIPLKVDGSAKYGIDIRLPGMLFAVIKHSPSFGGTLAVTPGVPAGALAVVPINVGAGLGRGADAAGNVNAVAVVAATTWDAMRAARGLSVKWNVPAAAANWNSAQFVADAQALAINATPFVAGAVNPAGTLYTIENMGDAKAALATVVSGRKVIDATYVFPYVSHACMEVLNCTVDYVPDVRCTIYAPTQVANAALTRVLQLTGLTADKVAFHTTMLGGGLGRKLEIDFISQAVQLAMALKRPVQLVWPREEDFTHDQYRPMAVVRSRAAVDAIGNVAAWTYRNVSPSIRAQRGTVLTAAGDSQGYEASQGLPYTFGSRLTEWVNCPSPIPVGYWRSVGASINTFAVESMMDELAAACGMDPVQFRRSKLSGDARWLAVLERAATLSNWGSTGTTGTAKGIAIGAAFNSICAAVVEVSGTSATSFTVKRVSVVLDAYMTVNPGNVEAQLAGGVVHGLNAALYGQQTFVGGVAQRRNFNSNRMMRLKEMPQVSVALIPNPATSDSTKLIGGVGELGVPTVAPALANAVFRLCGQRVRNLPFFPNATMGG
ncbi:molybdopterin cofactor-binding domain-containing protein [Rhodoferax sp.]|uniref:xanthine dehydrogenase family protein molybdopterin-binding subunit n=1 Tax=Rhodoferax sp. TaxID=50421 RepID=UPI001ED5914B|nr:molybdopterin cofactor-binding domain-containing protein [Rhodoferax sp.]MBT9506266.1 molybdopterin-dependent oxidoreductase [Rhodoferax sp.]